MYSIYIYMCDRTAHHCKMQRSQVSTHAPPRWMRGRLNIGAACFSMFVPETDSEIANLNSPAWMRGRLQLGPKLGASISSSSSRGSSSSMFSLSSRWIKASSTLFLSFSSSSTLLLSVLAALSFLHCWYSLHKSSEMRSEW